MAVRLEVFDAAAHHVQNLYKNERQLAKKERRPVRTFNELIRATMNDLHISRGDRNDLVHELAVFFGRRGGKAPHSKRLCFLEKMREWKSPSAALLRDMRKHAEEANEHIVPID